MPSSAVDPALLLGREHYRARRWADAFAALADADRRTTLSAEDLETLAWSAGLSGDDEELLRLKERLYARYVEVGDHHAAARIAFWIGFRLMPMNEVGRANGWFVRSERLIEQSGGESVTTGYLLLPAIRRQFAAGDHDAAYRDAETAVALAKRFSDKDLLCFARAQQARILLDRGQHERGLAFMDEVMLSCRAGELSPVITGLVYCMAIEGCHQTYALDRAREWTNTFAQWCDAQPQLAPFAGTCLVLRSEILQFEGAWSAAMEEARRAARPSTSIPAPVTAHALYQEAEIHRLRGEHTAAEEAYRCASDHGRDPQPGLALLRLAQGRGDVALTAVRRVLAGTSRPLERARLLPALVEILLATGDVEGARAGADELATTAASYGVEVLDAMAAHARGAVALAEGDAQRALVGLRQAFEAWQRAGAPYLAARVRVSLSRACRELGDHDGAELGLSAARQVFEELGAAADLAGLPPGETPASAADHGLTVRELEVLRLLSTGMTNKAISHELSLSEKTIDRHVSNIFVKVEVTSRAAATAFAYEKGIVRAGREPRG